jgi:hypothetical protein
LNLEDTQFYSNYLIRLLLETIKCRLFCVSQVHDAQQQQQQQQKQQQQQQLTMRKIG